MNELTCRWDLKVYEKDGKWGCHTRPTTLQDILLYLESIYGRTTEENEYSRLYVAEFAIAYAMIKPLPKE